MHVLLAIVSSCIQVDGGFGKNLFKGFWKNLTHESFLALLLSIVFEECETML